MKKSASVSTVLAPGFRVNEGVLVDVAVKSEVGVDGAIHTAFKVDLGTAHVPDRRYAADVCDVKFSKNETVLTFGQPQFGEHRLRTALTIRINPIATRQLVELINKMSDPGLDAIVAAHGIDAESLTSITEEPNQVVEVKANMAMVGVAGYESCIDFYYSSPFGVRDLQKHKKVAVDPVVRIDLRTALFLAIVARLKELLPLMPSPEVNLEK